MKGCPTTCNASTQCLVTLNVSVLPFLFAGSSRGCIPVRCFRCRFCGSLHGLQSGKKTALLVIDPKLQDTIGQPFKKSALLQTWGTQRFRHKDEPRGGYVLAVSRLKVL